jgi:hypothetical protein
VLAQLTQLDLKIRRLASPTRMPSLSCSPAFLPYTAAAMTAGDTNGGGMPQIPRGVNALPYPAAAGVLAAIAAAIAVAAALTTVRRDVT